MLQGCLSVLAQAQFLRDKEVYLVLVQHCERLRDERKDAFLLKEEGVEFCLAEDVGVEFEEEPAVRRVLRPQRQSGHFAQLQEIGVQRRVAHQGVCGFAGIQHIAFLLLQFRLERCEDYVQDLAPQFVCVRERLLLLHSATTLAQHWVLQAHLQQQVLELVRREEHAHFQQVPQEAHRLLLLILLLLLKEPAHDLVGVVLLLLLLLGKEQTMQLLLEDCRVLAQVGVGDGEETGAAAEAHHGGDEHGVLAQDEVQHLDEQAVVEDEF